MPSFLGLIALSQPLLKIELKLHTETNFYTLISNLELNFQYDIVMTS